MTTHDNSTYAVGDWVQCHVREPSGNEFPIHTRWKGPTGRDENGRFVRRGSESEMFLLDCGLVYSRLDIDRGAVRIERSTEIPIVKITGFVARWIIHRFEAGEADDEHAMGMALREAVNAAFPGVSEARVTEALQPIRDKLDLLDKLDVEAPASRVH